MSTVTRRRRRLLAALGVLLVALAAVAVYALREEPGWYVRMRYPLAYEGIVRGHAENYDLDPALHVTELRTMAADDLWLSGAYGTDAVSIQFTWRDLPDLVLPLLPRLEERLLPLGARPHWGKLFTMAPDVVGSRYARRSDFVRLATAVDPHGTFRNAFVDRYIFS